ncbi:MAG: family 78 glycoside hydrolase catalytic domain [Phycisphaerae bacterium]|nr:family 78 glycoside hydrolase catalytic domain [Phycisphaerae bacterium]
MGRDQDRIVSGKAQPARLRCEYLADPLGIDVVQPRLSWVVESEERGQHQTAYQVVVASTAELLAGDCGDLWDSGRVESDRTIHVEYAGKALASRMRCFWKVRVWDKDGGESAWSEPARWSMGLLASSDWQAQWIACGEPFSPKVRHGYLSGTASSADTPKWVVVDLGGERSIDAVRLCPARPHDRSSRSAYLFPVRYRIEVGRRSDFSDAVVVVDETRADVGDPGEEGPIHCFEPMSIRYVRLTVTRLAGGDGEGFAFALSEMEVLSSLEGWPQKDGSVVRQNVGKLACTVWAADSVEEDGWSREYLVDGCGAQTEPGCGWPADQPATMVRREFEVRGPIRRAEVSVTGLGVYELRINGRRVGDHLLAPEWTCYRKRIQYQTYDVTELLREGPNAVGGQLSGGWWTGPLWCMDNSMVAARCCLLMRLDIELADGSKQTVVSDGLWQASVEGPIRRAGIYFGETYDATREMAGWDEAGFGAAGWTPVLVLPHPHGVEQARLAAQPNEPIRVSRELRPVSVSEPKPGTYVFDMGQNMVGWCRLRADAPVGTKITVRHAEVLDEEGMLYTANLRGAAQVNEYTWGGGEAELEPHFTYHGFRYVEVTGLPYRPGLEAITGRVFHSAAPEAGAFACSNELVNQIMHCVEWVQRGNLHGVPTDCPQRTEREGWTGDIQAFSQTAVFNMDMAGFFTKWVRDIRDSQSDAGHFPDAAPHPSDPNRRMRGAPGWGDAGTIVPWRMYQNYADVRVLEEHYESAKGWIELIWSNNPGLLWLKDRGDGDYGDWLNGDSLPLPGYPRGISAAPKEVFGTAFFAHSAEIVGKMAAVLGRMEDAWRYGRLFEGIRAAFQRAYVGRDGRIEGDTQAGYALALHFGLLDEAMASRAVDHLVEAIGRYRSHVSTGMQATHRMMLELSRHGRHDEAWRLINLHSVPSWGYMIEQGATTIWERWDAYVEGQGPWGGFQHPDMNSFNHWAMGSVGEWVWRELAGIHPDENEPGYKHIVLRPRPCGDLRWVKARYESIRGPIGVEWRIGDGRFTLDIEVPANTTATVWVPAGQDNTVEAEGAAFIRKEGDFAVFAVGSGQYHFQAGR